MLFYCMCGFVSTNTSKWSISNGHHHSNCVREVHGYLCFFRRIFSNLSWINPRVLSHYITSFINTLPTMFVITSLLQLFIFHLIILHRNAGAMTVPKTMGRSAVSSIHNSYAMITCHCYNRSWFFQGVSFSIQ